MSVAREKNVLVSFAKSLECVEKIKHIISELQNLILEEKLEVHKHLVVTRTAGVDLLSHISKAACKKELHL